MNLPEEDDDRHLRKLDDKSSTPSRPGSLESTELKRKKAESSQFQALLREYLPGSNGFRRMWIDGFPTRVRKVKDARIRIFCGTFLQFAFAAIFVSIMYATYTSSVNAAFLSLSKEAGTCSTVPITTTQGVLLDSFGHWETDSKFVKQEALYYVQFSEYDGDNPSWAIDMADLNAVIHAELELLKATDDFRLKILHLTSWRKTINAKKGGTMRIWFNADPAAIFNFADHRFQAYIGTPSDECRTIDAWRYSGGKYTLTINDVWNGAGSAVSASHPGNLTHQCPSFDLLQLGFNW
jgi:hypothetical protein